MEQLPKPVRDFYDPPGVDGSGLDGDWYDPPQIATDQSRVPSRNAGLPIDPDLIAILAGGSGLATKPDVLGSAAGVVDDIRAFVNAILESLKTMSPVPVLNWIASKKPPWLDHVDFDLGALNPAELLKTILDTTTGLIKTNLLPLISPGQLVDNQDVNLVVDGDFTALPAESEVDGPGRWFHDPTRGKKAPGSAWIDGTAGELPDLLCEPIPVTPGKSVDITAELSWVSPPAGARGKVVVHGWSAAAGTLIESVTVDDEAMTGVVWKPLGGTYTPVAGVTLAVISCQVTGLTSGQAGFDDVKLHRAGLIPQRMVSELEEAWRRLLGAFGINFDVTGGLPGLLLVQAFVKNLLKLFQIFDLSKLLTTPGSFDPAAIGAQLIDALAPKVVQDIIDGVFNGFSNLGDMLDLGQVREIVPDVIADLLGIGTSNSSEIAAAVGRLLTLESGARTTSDAFERTASGSPGGTWSLFSSSGSAGAMGTDGKGNLVYRPSGTSNRTVFYRMPSALETDAATVAAVLATKPPTTSPDDAFGYFGAWCSASAVSYVRVRVGASQLVLQAVVAGTVHSLTSVSVSCKAGDTLALTRGVHGDTAMHTYTLTRNGQELLSGWVDPNSRAGAGSGFRHLVVGAETSWRLPLSQWTPAGFAHISYMEV